MPDPELPSPLARPASLTDLFLSFTRLALQGFGGVLPVAQRELVERKRWLTRQEFVEMLSIGQVLPGPNIVNISLMIGDRFFGLRGAFVALGGMLLAPLAVVLVLAAAYAHLAHHPLVSGALRGMGAVAAGLILATGIKLLGSLSTSILGRRLAWTVMSLTVLAVAGLRWPLVAVIACIGLPAVALAWWRLGQASPDGSHP